MEGIFVVLPLLLVQHAVFPVSAQTATLSTKGTFVENSNATFLCDFTAAAWDPATLRTWIGPGPTSVITNGGSTNANKYAEDISNTGATKQFSMTIINYDSSNEGAYQCQYGFATSNGITLSRLNTEAHPSSSTLTNLVIPKAGNEISLDFSVSGIRPAATASYNITSDQSTQTGNANVTSANDANGRTITSTVQINIPGSRIAGDIFTLTLVVGTYTQTEQWTIQANPDPNPDCPCTGETVLLSLSIAIMCMVLMHAWLVFLFTKGIIKWNIPTVSKCDNEKSPVNIIVVTITISLCCVIGMVLCAVGMSICQKCTSSDDNTGLILAIVGFVLVLVGLVVDILYVCIFQKKTAKCDQRNRPDGQEDNTFKKKETLPPIEDKSTSPTSASKIQTKINKMSGQVSDSNESDGGETARSKLGNVPLGRKLPPLQPGAEQSQPSEDTTGVKKLKKKKKKKNKEEQKNDKEDDNE